MTGGESRGALRRERPPTPESAREIEPVPDQRGAQADVAVAAQVNAPPPAPSAAAVVRAPQQDKDALRMKVERVLEENLWDLYLALPTEQRKKFRAAGEAVATEMRAMIGTQNIRPSDVHKKIDRWLRTIPKVNPWFLLQEGKIKTDGVIAIANDAKGAE